MRLPEHHHHNGFIKANSFDGFQRKKIEEGDGPPGIRRTSVVHDNAFSNEERKIVDDQDEELPPGIHRRPSKESRMFINENSDSKAEIEYHPSVHRLEDLVRRISISSLDEAKAENQSRGIPSVERGFENNYFTPSTPDDVIKIPHEGNMPSQLELDDMMIKVPYEDNERRISISSLHASSPSLDDNLTRGIATASVVKSRERRDKPRTPDLKMNVAVEPLIEASPIQIEEHRREVEKVLEEKKRRRESYVFPHSNKEPEKKPISFLDVLNIEAKTMRNELREKTQKKRAKKLLDEMKQHELATRRLSQLDMDIVKIAQVAHGTIQEKLDNNKKEKEQNKPHFVSDAPPGLHHRLSKHSKQFLLELHEKIEEHQGLNRISHSAHSLHDELHGYMTPGSKHYVPEWKRCREVVLKRFEERLEREESERKKTKKKYDTTQNDSIDKEELAKYVRERQEAKFILGIKLMERDAIEKSRHVHERRVHNLLLDIADNKKGSNMSRNVNSSPAVHNSSVVHDHHKKSSSDHHHHHHHKHQKSSPHKAKIPKEHAYTLPVARLRKCWDIVVKGSFDGISTVAQFMTLLAGLSNIVFPSDHPLMIRLGSSSNVIRNKYEGVALRAFLVNNILVRAEELFHQLRRSSSSSISASPHSPKTLLRVLFFHYLGRLKSIHFDVLLSMLRDCGIRLTQSRKASPDIRLKNTPTTRIASLTSDKKLHHPQLGEDNKNMSLRDAVQANIESLRFLYGVMLMISTSAGGLDGGDYENAMTLLLPRSMIFDHLLRRSFVDGTRIGPLRNPRAGVVRTIAFEGFIHALTVYASELMIRRTNILKRSQYDIARDGVDLCISFSLRYLFRIFRDRIRSIIVAHSSDKLSAAICQSHRTFCMTHPNHPGLFTSL